MRPNISALWIWFRHGFDGETLILSAALAYTTLLAVVPLITVVFSALSLFPVFQEWSTTVEAFVFDNFVPASGEVINTYIQQFRGQVGKLTLFGLVTLLLTSLMLLSTIENALNKIWRVATGRSPGQRLLVYWTLLTLGPILVVASLAVSSYLLATELMSGVVESASGTRMLFKALPFLFEFCSFVLLYYVVPNREIRLAHAAFGAVVAVILFEIAKVGFTWYVTDFNSFEVIYGALGVIPVFLIWIYISWLVILAGARYAARLETG